MVLLAVMPLVPVARCLVISQIAAIAFALSCGAPSARTPEVGAPGQAPLKTISVPEGTAGIGFDDVRFDADLDRVLVPAGHTGRLYLLDPSGLGLGWVGGFSTKPAFPGGHDVGATSADGGDGLIVAVDRTSRLLDVVDAKAKAIISSSPLGGKPDLVRYAGGPGEVWVTEPDDERIEVFALSRTGRPGPTHRTFIATKGGPESLTIDPRRGHAYTYVANGTTLSIDLTSHAVVAQWESGCAEASGAALDDDGGRLFVGCSEGKVVVLDVTTGRPLASISVGSSIDHIAYSPRLRHLYVPDTKGAIMSTLAVSSRGDLSLLGSVATVPGTECVTTDDRGHAFLCDPGHGQIFVIVDRYPAASR